MSTFALFPGARPPHSELSTDAQCTPLALTRILGRFGVDPCSNPLSTVQADRTCMLELGQDGLSDPWTLDGSTTSPLASVWCNGPYSGPLPWCERLRAHQAPWASLWKLDPTTQWFREALALGPASTRAWWAPFARRLPFVRAGNVGVAEFPSVLIWRDWKVPRALRSWLMTPRRER